MLGGNVPYFAWPGIDMRYTPAICLARASGYELARYAHNMAVPLATAPGCDPCVWGSLRHRH